MSATLTSLQGAKATSRTQCWAKSWRIMITRFVQNKTSFLPAWCQTGWTLINYMININMMVTCMVTDWMAWLVDTGLLLLIIFTWSSNLEEIQVVLHFLRNLLLSFTFFIWLFSSVVFAFLLMLRVYSFDILAKFPNSENWSHTEF